MTDATDQSPATTGVTADYQKTIRVKASPRAVFDALTSVAWRLHRWCGVRVAPPGQALRPEMEPAHTIERWPTSGSARSAG
jgi:hypothetical protein